jgi:transposase
LHTAGHSLHEVAERVDVGKHSVQRVIDEPRVTDTDTGQERARRRIGMKSKAEPYRATITDWLEDDPALRSVELLRRAKLACCGGRRARSTRS